MRSAECGIRSLTDRDAKAGLAFFTVLILYGQLLTYGFWVATGVVEEKASRVIEVLLGQRGDELARVAVRLEPAPVLAREARTQLAHRCASGAPHC